ncbi:MAG: cysteine desulfurase [Verrucomicrobia bacterium]|nr:cysteine desulfurase [Verrucomicrobiota bacterium]
MSEAHAGPEKTNPPAVGSEALRRDFPILDQIVNRNPLIYLDNAATTQKPRVVIDALRNYYERDNANVHRGVHELSNRSSAAYERGRERAARFIHAKRSSEVIFTRGTTESINLVAQAWGTAHVKQGDTILLTDMEHHSNIVPWQLLAERVGARMAYLPVADDRGLLDLNQLDQKLTSDVRVFAFTHVSNSLGTVNPAREFCRRARARGITTVVDAAQSIGHGPIDVQELDCDFLAFSGHKMCGPTGIGGLYGRHELLEATPPYQGGGDMIATVGFEKSTWNQLPHKFEAGTPNIAGVVGLHAAMDYLDAIGRSNIARYDHELGAHAYEELSRLKGIRLFGPHIGRAGLVSFLLNDVHAHDLVTVADQRGIALRGGHHCNQPLMNKLGVVSTARASFYFYNTHQEIERLIEVLREIQKFFDR